MDTLPTRTVISVALDNRPISVFELVLVRLLAVAKRMPSFKDPNAFADPEDSELVRNNKRQITESIAYNYTEVIKQHKFGILTQNESCSAT